VRSERGGKPKLGASVRRDRIAPEQHEQLMNGRVSPGILFCVLSDMLVGG
jgi:hypothetical protein